MTHFSRRTALAATAAAVLSPSLSFAQGTAPMITAQAPGFYRYKVGEIIVTAINDGFGQRPVEGFIRNADLAEVKKTLEAQALSPETLKINYTTLVFQTSEGLVMIDAGNGNMGPPTSGAWMANFKAAGFDPKDVKKVIFSHFHGDHINGFRLKEGNVVFPNAEVLVPEMEWAHWMSDDKMNAAPDAAKPAFMNVRRVFAPIAKDVKQYKPETEVAKGILAVAAYGHSPGHSVFAVNSGNESLMVMSDTTNHPALFAKMPDWSAIFDMNADEARATRHKLLDRVASDKMQVAFYHAPFPAVGKIVRDGKGYAMVANAWGQ
jgi:glyoxylase-like metal-dependent hydrolase (beta-lactamase superfamily II)